jgi:hypothetical protein
MDTYERWQVEIIGWGRKIIFDRARRNAKGAWICDAGKLPKSLKEYLDIQTISEGSSYSLGDFTSINDFRERTADNRDIQQQTVKNPSLDARFIAIIPASSLSVSEREEAAAIVRAKEWKKKSRKNVIWSLKDLAVYVGAENYLRPYTTTGAVSGIARRLYKDTDCGITFTYTEKPPSVKVAGFCEGSQGYGIPYTLYFPFTQREWNDAVKSADLDGCDEWHQLNRLKEA